MKSSDTDIQRAFAQAEAERLAFERDFGPIVEQEQLAAAQRQFNQDFGPLVEQEIADTRNRQRAQFEQDFGRQEAEAEQERLTEERLAREQFEKEFGGGRDQVLSGAELARQRADAEAFSVIDANGVDRSGLSESDWAILLNAQSHGVHDPNSTFATEEPLGLEGLIARTNEVLNQMRDETTFVSAEAVEKAARDFGDLIGSAPVGLNPAWLVSEILDELGVIDDNPLPLTLDDLLNVPDDLRLTSFIDEGASTVGEVLASGIESVPIDIELNGVSMKQLAADLTREFGELPPADVPSVADISAELAKYVVPRDAFQVAAVVFLVVGLRTFWAAPTAFGGFGILRQLRSIVNSALEKQERERQEQKD